MKKAQGLSMTTIVVAALALLVLIVIAAVFTQKVGKGTSQIEDIASPVEYKARCLKDNPDAGPGYDSCVKKCEKTPSNPDCKLTEKKK